MRASKKAAADWRPRRASDGKYSIAFFFAHQIANTIETIIQFCGERMGPPGKARPRNSRRAPR